MNRREMLPTYHYEDSTDGNLQKSAGQVLRDYRIYGNSVQNGTPSPDNPVDIQSVGDLVTDTSSEFLGKYKIPVTVNGQTTNIYLDEPLRKIEQQADYIDFKNQKVVRIIDGCDFISSRVTNTYGYQESHGVTLGKYMKDTGDIRRNYVCNRADGNKWPPLGMWFGAGGASTQNVFWLGILDCLGIYSAEKTSAEMLTEFKAWLDANPTYAIYPLNTPIEETINLPDIPTPKGNAIISVDTSIQPSGVNWQYYRSK